jgi:hypothetical protein
MPKVRKLLLICLGWISVALGAAGIFLPLLPTTVFLLLATWCFARSSERFHTWILEHPKLGPIIKAWQSGDGLEKKLKIKIIVSLWLSMFLSVYIVANWVISALLIIIGLGVTTYIYRLPLRSPEK